MDKRFLSGLSQFREALIQIKSTAQQQQAVTISHLDQENSLNISKNRFQLIGQGKSFIQGNYSPSPSKNQTSFMTNAKILHNLESPITKQPKGAQQILQDQTNLPFEQHAGAQSMVQNSTFVQQNQSRVIRASDQMESIWLRQTIDQLCEDNRVLSQNLDDAMVVINKLQEKLLGSSQLQTQFRAQQEFSKILYEKYQRQLVITSMKAQ